ncbi:hypothetical protein Scep_021154 [Stephania cephalantha]|uniref:Uncharacterized protein n=1 Tax=Stephania cephalantha TaxID=152367 RepID=A0AAP0I1A6_9MAGN
MELRRDDRAVWTDGPSSAHGRTMAKAVARPKAAREREERASRRREVAPAEVDRRASQAEEDGERAAARGPATTPTAEEKRKEEKEKEIAAALGNESACAFSWQGSGALARFNERKQRCNGDGERGERRRAKCATKDVERRAVACCLIDRSSTRGANSTKFDDEMEATLVGCRVRISRRVRDISERQLRLLEISLHVTLFPRVSVYGRRDGVTIFRSLVDDDPIVATVLVIP